MYYKKQKTRLHNFVNMLVLVLLVMVIKFGLYFGTENPDAEVLTEPGPIIITSVYLYSAAESSGPISI